MHSGIKLDLRYTKGTDILYILFGCCFGIRLKRVLGPISIDPFSFGPRRSIQIMLRDI